MSPNKQYTAISLLSTNTQLSNLLIVAEMYSVSRTDAAVATMSVVIPLKAGNFHVFFALLYATQQLK